MRTSSIAPGQICTGVSDVCDIRDENSPRGPLAGCKALHISLDCGIDEVFLDSACWVVRRRNEREHGVHSLQDLGQLLRVLIVCLNPSYTLGGRCSRSVLCRSISCNDTIINTGANKVRTFLDSSRISCFSVATRTSIISCATSAGP